MNIEIHLDSVSVMIVVCLYFLYLNIRGYADMMQGFSYWTRLIGGVAYPAVSAACFTFAAAAVVGCVKMPGDQLAWSLILTAVAAIVYLILALCCLYWWICILFEPAKKIQDPF